MRRVARDRQKISARSGQALHAGKEFGERVGPAVQQSFGTVRNLGIAVDQQRNVVLVSGHGGARGDLLVQTDRRRRPHASQHPCTSVMGVLPHSAADSIGWTVGEQIPLRDIVYVKADSYGRCFANRPLMP